MSLSSGAAAVMVSGLAGLLLGVAVFFLLGRRESVADRVSAYVDLRSLEEHSNKSLIERALGDRQARQIVRSPWLERMRIEMDVADINVGFEQLLALSLVLAVLVGWLLYSSTAARLPHCWVSSLRWERSWG